MEIRPKHIISETLETKGSSNRFELYFETEFIEEKHKHIKSENIEFLHEIHEEPWGQRTIRFFDPDKHLIEIGEPLQTFINNMNKKGLSAKQITEKSGVPIETIKSLLNKKG